MSEHRNLIMAIVLSMVILLGWQYIFPPASPPPSDETVQAQTGNVTPAPSQLPSVVASQTANAVVGNRVENCGPPTSASPRLAIETGRLTGSISLQGARLDDLVLADYQQTIDEGSPAVRLLNPNDVPHPYFFETGWAIPEGSGQAIALPGVCSVWKASSDRVTSGSPVDLTWDNGQGLTFTQRIEVDENYLFTITHSVTNNSAGAIILEPYGRVRRLGTPEISDFFIIHEGPLGVFEEKKELDYSDLREEDDGIIRETSPGGGWIGFSDKFWMVALIPDQGTPFNGTFSHEASGGLDKYQTAFQAPSIAVPTGSTGSSTVKAFAGAKEVHLISAYEESESILLFDKAIDWGWFEFLTRPFFHAIDFFNGLLGNFGLAIIAVTFVVKFAFLPLAWKSYVSMAKMRALQPEIVKLRERAGDDRMKMQQDMMALYKKEKVNPVSGCLPILLQIPVFFALYKVLFVTIEMRHAPFYGWVHDLSEQDPTNLFELFGLIPWDTPDIMHLGVWPLAMGISMFAQQKINPQPPDPMQARIMMMLPIVFTFFLARFPAGLVIYWTVNNLLSIAQQATIMRLTAKKTAATKSGV
jgi:YidC/Oxa1 family membrane protein insertase